VFWRTDGVSLPDIGIAPHMATAAHVTFDIIFRDFYCQMLVAGIPLYLIGNVV